MTLPKEVDLDPNKIALGCEDTNEENVKVCRPAIKFKGRLVQMSNNRPEGGEEGDIFVEKIKPDQFAIIKGGKDLTTDELQALSEALRKTDLER